MDLYFSSIRGKFKYLSSGFFSVLLYLISCFKIYHRQKKFHYIAFEMFQLFEFAKFVLKSFVTDYVWNKYNIKIIKLLVKIDFFFLLKIHSVASKMCDDEVVNHYELIRQFRLKLKLKSIETMYFILIRLK